MIRRSTWMNILFLIAAAVIIRFVFLRAGQHPRIEENFMSTQGIVGIVVLVLAGAALLYWFVSNLRGGSRSNNASPNIVNWK